MRIIFLGAPGAGKGTHAATISKTLNIPAISTGDIIREALKNGTEMGKKAKSFIDSGNLVPDEVVIGIVKERIAKDDCAKGFILDGFPRTIPQAEALDNMGVQIDSVINLEISDEAVMNRMSGRRVCEKCGATYHLVNNKPKVEGICDKCNGTLVQRKDDQPETVKARLKIYHEQTEPLINYYTKQGKLSSIDATTGLENVAHAILKALEA